MWNLRSVWERLAAESAGQCQEVGRLRWPPTPQDRLERQDAGESRFSELTSAQQEAVCALYFKEEESVC